MARDQIAPVEKTRPQSAPPPCMHVDSAARSADQTDGCRTCQELTLHERGVIVNIDTASIWLIDKQMMRRWIEQELRLRDGIGISVVCEGGNRRLQRGRDRCPRMARIAEPLHIEYVHTAS